MDNTTENRSEVVTRDPDVELEAAMGAAALRLLDWAQPVEAGLMLLAQRKLFDFRMERTERQVLREVAAPEPKKTNGAPRPRRAGNPPLAIAQLCLCTHRADAHGPAGNCLKCTCEVFEENPSAAPCRHDYADGSTCIKCGKAKSVGGRPRKEGAAEPPAPPVDTRTAPLPGFAPGAADRFAGGGLGSSGRER